MTVIAKGTDWQSVALSGHASLENRFAALPANGEAFPEARQHLYRCRFMTHIRVAEKVKDVAYLL